MTQYSPGRGHKHDKAIQPPSNIVNMLNDQNPGFSCPWSTGHTKEGARVKAFRANKGQHPAWQEYNTDDLEFFVSDPQRGMLTDWTVWVKRISKGKVRKA